MNLQELRTEQLNRASILSQEVLNHERELAACILAVAKAKSRLKAAEVQAWLEQPEKLTVKAKELNVEAMTAEFQAEVDDATYRKNLTEGMWSALKREYHITMAAIQQSGSTEETSND